MSSRTCHPNDPHCLFPECICTNQTPELPDDLRAPLHSLQADVRYLIGRVVQDHDIESMVVDSILSRLSQIEEASYRFLFSEEEDDRYRTALEKIANGEGYYGAQAREYKEIARKALEAAR